MSITAHMPPRIAAALSGTLAVAALMGGTASPASAATTTCTRFAAPSGSDSAAGTEAAPYRSAQKLVDSVSSGQTGCLRSGTFTQDVKVSRAEVKLTSFPGERAKLVGRLWVAQGANDVTVSSLDLDGTNAARLPGPTVNANRATFEDNDVTNGHRAESCFILGSSTYGRADDVTIRRNRIHNCGTMPATNHDHGIYAAKARGGEVTDNVIYDNADRGVQLYPDADDFEIRRNVIDGNGQGVIFSGDGGAVSTGNRVENNVITHAKIRWNLESWYPSGNPVGSGNVARHNCLYGGVRDASLGGVRLAAVGFTLEENLVADPRYKDRGDKDFDLESDSPCREVLEGDAPDLPPPPGDDECPTVSTLGEVEADIEAMIPDSGSSDEEEVDADEGTDTDDGTDGSRDADGEEAPDEDAPDEDAPDEDAPAEDADSDDPSGDEEQTDEADEDESDDDTASEDEEGSDEGASESESDSGPEGSDDETKDATDDETVVGTSAATGCEDGDGGSGSGDGDGDNGDNGSGSGGGGSGGGSSGGGGGGGASGGGGGGGGSGGGGSGGGGSGGGGGGGGGGGSATAPYAPAPLVTAPGVTPTTPAAGSSRSRARRCPKGRAGRKASVAAKRAGRRRCVRPARR